MLRKIREKIIRSKTKVFAKQFSKTFFENLPFNLSNILNGEKIVENRFVQLQQRHNLITRYKYTQPPKPNKNLKVAVCISGFLRTYQDTSKAFIKNVIDRYNADIFIYAPNESGVSGDIANINSSSGNQKVTEKELYSAYGQNNIKAYELWEYDGGQFEKVYKEHNIPFTIDGRNPSRIISAFYHIKKCNDLKKEYEEKNNFKYDIVIKTRGDVGFYSPLVLEGLEDLQNTVYYTGGNFDKNGKRLHEDALAFPYKNIERGEYIGAGELAINDYINISSSENIDALSEAYDFLIEYSKRGIMFAPETLLAYHLVFEKKLNLEMKDFITCEIFRENHPKKWNPQMSDKDWDWISYQLYS